MNEYSQRKLRQILARQPDWVAKTRKGLTDGSEYFEIFIPSPVSNQPDIRIESYGDELSVYWGDWHTHLVLWDETDDGEDVDQLFELLDALFAEEIVVVCTYRPVGIGGRKWAGSSCGAIGSHDPPESGMIWVMFSWLGTHSKSVDGRAPWRRWLS